MRFDGLVVVYDLEWTAWEGSAARKWSGPGEHREIIQIGAVMLDADQGFAERFAFDCIVAPRVNRQLSAYVQDLTGITQERIEAEGVDLAEAFECFADFAGSAPLLSNGRDFRVVAENCTLYGLDEPFAADRYGNLDELFPALAGRVGHVVSGELPAVFGFDCNLPAHDALADARMVAQALRVLRAGGRI